MNKELEIIEKVLKRKYPFIIGIEPSENLNNSLDVTYFIDIIVKTDKLGSVIDNYKSTLDQVKRGYPSNYHGLYLGSDDYNDEESKDVITLRQIQNDIEYLVELIHNGTLIPDEYKVDRKYLEVNMYRFK
jgi:hypothetical protein